MEKLCELIDKEIRDIEKDGFNMSNIEAASKFVEMKKNIQEIKKGEGEQMRRYRDYNDYRDGGYRDSYRSMDYRRYSDDDDDYGRRGVPGSGRYRDGGYSHHMMDRERGRFDDNLDRLADCVDMYEYARGRYREGGSEERMEEGLEKLMYSLCMFVESAMNFADSPKEKEIIRKHVQKLQTI